MVVLTSLFMIIGLASVHLFSQNLRVLDGVPRSRFLSLAGGMAVSFVLLRLLPALSEGQEAIEETTDRGSFYFLKDHVYIVALLSLVIFYGLERLAKGSRKRRREAGKEDTTSLRIFWLHISTFAVMNGLIGYLLLHNQERGLKTLLLFFIAIALKFIVNDHGLHADHKEKYDRIGRWILAAAVLLGWGIRYLHRFPQLAPVFLQAFLAGGVLLNVLKEELPEQRESRYWVFALGAIGYALLLLAF